jgi:hypothetical protein
MYSHEEKKQYNLYTLNFHVKIKSGGLVHFTAPKSFPVRSYATVLAPM